MTIGDSYFDTLKFFLNDTEEPAILSNKLSCSNPDTPVEETVCDEIEVSIQEEPSEAPMESSAQDMSTDETTPLYKIESEEETNPYSPHHNSTYDIVSRIAYLLGVSKSIFENEHEAPQLEWYNKLNEDRCARIVRNLCMLRTRIEQNFAAIHRAIFYDLKNLHTLPEFISPQIISDLEADGIQLIKANYKLNSYVIDINRLISDRINNCKNLFPLWLDWNYVKPLFIMPDGQTEAGIKRAGYIYSQNRNFYPYQVYMNWTPEDHGNLLYNDKKFVSWLYNANGELFTDLSKVSDAADLTKNNIYDFIAASQNTVFVVDCENSDPYKLCSTLLNLEADELEKVSKIILYDDVHTASAWRILDRILDIPVEHTLVERIKSSKSLVDTALSVGTCREFFLNHVDSFVIVSSDSDYWGLISNLPEANFLLMVEHENCGIDIRNAMESCGIYYCYIDDFCSGNNEELKTMALLNEIQTYIEDRFQGFNVKEMMEQAYLSTRVHMSDAEKRQFQNKYVKPMHLSIDNDGNVSIQLSA
ncbi:MAG: hypothetical protein ACOX7K_02045 [Oscillospiraceae bacterium]|jgi:hypothetical protein